MKFSMTDRPRDRLMRMWMKCADKDDGQYYTGINRVENSLIGVGPFILASVEYEMLTAAIET